MSRFRRRKQEVPGLNLASMPDLIFTVLFFFMIVTHMRQDDVHVRFTVPQGTELEKTAHRGNVVHIYIGHPTDGAGPDDGAETRIQVNSRIVTIDQLANAVAEEREQMSADDRRNMTVSILADGQTDMGLISDVKQALRQAGALHINYVATNRTKTLHPSNNPMQKVQKQ